MRKFILNLALGLFLLSCVMPPWAQTFDLNGSTGGHIRLPIGYYFIFSPPVPIKDPFKHADGITIDYGRLVLEWLIIGGIAFMPFAFGKMARS